MVFDINIDNIFYSIFTLIMRGRDWCRSITIRAKYIDNDDGR